MRGRCFSPLIVAALCLSFSSDSGIGQEAAPAKAKRKPDYWADLNLTPEQLKQVEAKQAAVKSQLDDLEKQLDELEAKRKDLTKQRDKLRGDIDDELKKILTEEQRKIVNEKELQAKMKRAERLQKEVDEIKKSATPAAAPAAP